MSMTNGSAEEQRNEQRTREFLDELFNKGNFAAIEEYLTPDFNDHTLSPGQEPGLEGFRNWVMDYRAAFPDLKVTVERLISRDDFVVIHLRQQGTNSGPWKSMGMPATGRTIDFRGLDLVRIKDGRATEHWGYIDEMTMMQQLGMMPEEGSSSETMSKTQQSNGG